jgi:hypothetical protein
MGKLQLLPHEVNSVTDEGAGQVKNVMLMLNWGLHLDMAINDNRIVSCSER